MPAHCWDSRAFRLAFIFSRRFTSRSPSVKLPSTLACFCRSSSSCIFSFLICASSSSFSSASFHSSTWAASCDTTVMPEVWGSGWKSPFGMPSGMMTSPCFWSRAEVYGLLQVKHLPGPTAGPLLPSQPVYISCYRAGRIRSYLYELVPLADALLELLVLVVQDGERVLLSLQFLDMRVIGGHRTFDLSSSSRRISDDCSSISSMTSFSVSTCCALDTMAFLYFSSTSDSDSWLGRR
ncbi:hypothetical protein CRUP_018548 [Coryphaenoides rupestris]|nr:hypothetical protein CRUP_018548 [Coryphaenoides rupestris]